MMMMMVAWKMMLGLLVFAAVVMVVIHFVAVVMSMILVVIGVVVVLLVMVMIMIAVVVVAVAMMLMVMWKLAVTVLMMRMVRALSCMLRSHPVLPELWGAWLHHCLLAIPLLMMHCYLHYEPPAIPKTKATKGIASPLP